MNTRFILRVLLPICLLGGTAACATSSPPDAVPASRLLYTPTPTVAPQSADAPPGGSPSLAEAAPTPQPHPTRRPPQQITRTYVVQYGDTLSGIAAYLGLTVEELMEANQLTNADQLQVGQELHLPISTPYISPGEILFPDSEMVYGPAYAEFDVRTATAAYDGYFHTYTETLLNGETLSAAELVERVALQYSVGPRVLLALLEAQSHWLTDADPPTDAQTYPLGFVRDGWEGLAAQLMWAADALNAGFYGWLYDTLWTFRLEDGSYVQFAPSLNAGTAGVQRALASSPNYAVFLQRLDEVTETYKRLWGNPFTYTVEPLLPQAEAPTLALPWPKGKTWYFTGGPHGGWGNGSAWAAVDFATDEQNLGCAVSRRWATAAADGLIVASEDGMILQDLDGDGFAGTGWVLLYMHLAAEGRVSVGTQVETGDPIGHPSCEGGQSNASHLHFARRYNGVWIAADLNTSHPLVMDGWTFLASDRPYDGEMRKQSLVKRAEEDWLPTNAITH
ncbi:MAG: LysM peptidoglycan-binding domain-containing protein [Anaerolineae bacterium]